MIEYPRIYSLSTVGVIMHYNQDYLLHPVRTDFTGRNGIGKSLIADLIQLVFITERKLIVFGTDSVKKKVREVHTLPYNTSDAYVFMNIEVAPDQFVVIGVNIPNKKSRPLRSFWILNRNHNDRDDHELKDLCIERSNLVTHRDFILDGTIPSIDKLATHLRDSKGLFLRSFTEPKQKQEFYSFLYSKELLSINLAIEEHRKAFARIIQSFSKAKSLNTDSDKSLKEFLFESDEEVLKEQFENNQRDLEKILKDTQELDLYIKELTSKQGSLLKLRDLDTKRVKAYQVLLSTRVFVSTGKLKTLKKDLEEAEKKYKSSEEELAVLENKTLPELDRQIKEVKAALKTATERKTVLEQYKVLFEKRVKTEKEIGELLQIELPDLATEESQRVNMEAYDLKETKRRIILFNPIYKKYGSLAAMQKKTSGQKKQISEHRNRLDECIRSLEQIQSLMSLNKVGTLFSQLFEEKKSLSKKQETVLMAILSDASFGKPAKADARMKYVNDLDILDDRKIEEDNANQGYWFKMGGIYEFVAQSSDKQLFANADELAEAVKTKYDEAEDKLTQINRELSQLEQFERGDNYDAELIQMPEELDQDLRDHTAFEYLRETLGIIQNLTTEVKRWNEEIAEMNDQLSALKEKLPSVDEQRLDETLDNLSETIKTIEKSERELSEEQIKKSGRVESLKENLPLQEEMIKTKREDRDELEKQFQADQGAYDKNFPEASIEDQAAPNIPLRDLEQTYEMARENYVTEYRSIANGSQSLLNKPEIDEQIEGKHYNFSVLEVALLGNRIKHTDEIAQALQGANRDRDKLMKTLHQAMLKIFSTTKKKYEDYDAVIKDLNIFFGGKKISEKYTFRIHLKPHPQFKIEWINQLQSNSDRLYPPGELPLGVSVESFVEDFFQKATHYKQRMALTDLLDPKTYFEVETKLTDDLGNEKPGSTGESYSAIVLLGIGRLSIIQKGKRKGIKFVILEETANLDRVNFNTFPDIAQEFGYQILTMTPRPYGSDSDAGWYLYHLIEGFDDPNINYPVPSSYFKTNENKEDLMTYLQAMS